ncbi:MAG: hypothetical protein AB9842_00225 [Bacteroidales bacterium]
MIMTEVTYQLILSAAEDAILLHKEDSGIFHWRVGYLPSLQNVEDYSFVRNQVRILLINRGLITESNEDYVTQLTEKGWKFSTFKDLDDSLGEAEGMKIRINELTEEYLKLKLQAEKKPWKSAITLWSIVLLIASALLSAFFSWLFK